MPENEVFGQAGGVRLFVRILKTITLLRQKGVLGSAGERI